MSWPHASNDSSSYWSNYVVWWNWFLVALEHGCIALDARIIITSDPTAPLGVV